jgi:hypothetical protein
MAHIKPIKKDIEIKPTIIEPPPKFAIEFLVFK